ncbi:hydrolase [Robiginitalea sp. IMCC44478]|uniref:hydrolase n=1 Tax=Robiginitalea sp. IMCC44478 TaxID=3459122 RepID=UPI0040428740
MSRRIFMYLFFFAALIILYLGVSGNRQSKSWQKEKTRMQEEIGQLQDSLQGLHLDLLGMQYFSLANNDDALAYYDHLGMEDPSGYISDKLLESNERAGDNPLVPYEGMEGDFKINKIKILNHKWIVADFSDGKFWGELFLQYELKDNGDVDFTLLDHLLYTRSQ